jgi:NAD(P)H-hydrate epimerase
MRILTTQQCRDVDEWACKAYGLTDEILMEAAGLQAARECVQNFYPELTRGLTALICGPGNNGADGFVMARHLHSMGFRNLLVVVASDKKRAKVAPKKKKGKIAAKSVADLWSRQLDRVEKHGIRTLYAFDDKKKLQQLASAELIVDALFGIGFHKKFEGAYLALVNQINSLKAPVVSLDIPSGLNADTGVTLSAAIKAHTTFTFGLPKPGFFVADGPQLVGKLRVLSIGYPYECLRGIATTHFLFNEKLARRYLPDRKDRSNKSDYGRLVIMAGSENMWGAGILAAQSAYRLGAGYVIWAGRDLPLKKLEEMPEVLTAKLDDDTIWDTEKVSAYAVGPGLGVNDDTAKIIRKLKDLKVEKVLLDADALSVCAKSKLFPLPKSWVVTPHAGELSRLLRMDVRDIEKDRYAAALKAAAVLGCHILLKGYRSILAFEKRCMVIHAGNAALAKAGAGDVLTGMIGSLLAQGLEPLQATATAAYLHGRIADDWVRSGADKRALNPSDLKDSLAHVVSRMSQGTIF